MFCVLTTVNLLLHPPCIKQERDKKWDVEIFIIIKTRKPLKKTCHRYEKNFFIVVKEKSTQRHKHTKDDNSIAILYNGRCSSYSGNKIVL